MKTIIANPIYDVVFKCMMENMQVAKILLSALLKREIIELEFGRNEFSKSIGANISLFRIDFSALVRDKKGREQRITIEVQKTWGSHEILRFRQYLGKQYLAPENMKLMDNDRGSKQYFAVPLVTIYILGHRIGDIPEPVVYVSRNYFDYDDQIIEYKDKFIESISHDSIVVQIPLLHGKTRNYLERILQIFDQEYIIARSNHLLEFEEDRIAPEKNLEPIIRCLTKIASDPEIRDVMDAEDVYLAEMEFKNNELMEATEELNAHKAELHANKAELNAIEEQLNAKNKSLQSAITLLSRNGLNANEIAEQLSLTVEDVKSMM